MNLPQGIQVRRDYSLQRLEELYSKIGGVSELQTAGSGLSIYVTGSYGRLEAWEHSDLDLFFIQSSKVAKPVSKVQKTLIDAELIKISREMNLPEFSKDAIYLKIHCLEDILEALGSGRDDYENYFTARLLLLLESLPVYNKEMYESFMEEIIRSYYRDYHDHEASFRPIFLVNDILRFWKTLCLNYEHRRNRPPDDPNKRNSNHLKNLKLKFSRKLTCYSLIILLSQGRGIVTPDKLKEFVQLTPVDRLVRAAEAIDDGEELLAEILKDYAWFLDITNSSKSELIEWIAEQHNRHAAFEHARSFGNKIYDMLLRAIGDDDTLRYLVI